MISDAGRLVPNGRFPLSSSYNSTPSEYTSSATAAGLPRRTSGLEYCGVKYRVGLSSRALASSMGRASPKSTNFASPERVTRMLPGLISQYTPPVVDARTRLRGKPGGIASTVPGFLCGAHRNNGQSARRPHTPSPGTAAHPPSRRRPERPQYWDAGAAPESAARGGSGPPIERTRAERKSLFTATRSVTSPSSRVAA